MHLCIFGSGSSNGSMVLVWLHQANPFTTTQARPGQAQCLAWRGFKYHLPPLTHSSAYPYPPPRLTITVHTTCMPAPRHLLAMHHSVGHGAATAPPYQRGQ